MNKIGNNIRRLRLDHHMTQQQLADKLNVTNKTISKWETGRNMADVEMLGKIAEMFDISLDELLTDRKRIRLKTKKLFIVLFVEMLIFVLMMFSIDSLSSYAFIVSLAFPHIITMLSATITSYFVSIKNIFIKMLKYCAYVGLCFYSLLAISYLFPSTGIGVFLTPADPTIICPIAIVLGFVIGI